MTNNLLCFKQYDIRGKVPDLLNLEIVFYIGRALIELFSFHHVVTGYDARLSSHSLQKALAAGIESAGAIVTNIGLCTTEEIYFASTIKNKSGHLLFDGGIMVTGSHNPSDENGLKLVYGGAIPISKDTGLLLIKERVQKFLSMHCYSEELSFTPINEQKASFRKQYLEFLCQISELGQGISTNSIRLHLDPGNGCAGLLAKDLCEKAGFSWSGSNMEPNGNFPNGIPNPLLPEKRTMTSQSVRENKADIGIAWDGDADRCFFYDEEGNFIEGYYIVGLLAGSMLHQFPGAKIIHDPRLYWNTHDIIIKNGGIPIQSKTGHAFIKECMRAEDAVYGGEMSAHHYFRASAYCDSGMLPWLLVTKLIADGNQSLGERVYDRMNLFPCSGEINSRVEEPQKVLERVQKKYSYQAYKEEYIDGLSMEFEYWRFNLRLSNTESLLRLNVESKGDKALMEDKTAEILALIRA